MPAEAVRRTGREPERSVGRAVILLAVLVAVAETLVLVAGDAPALHLWLAAGLAVAVVGVAYRKPSDPMRRSGVLVFLTAISLVNRVSVRFEVAPSPSLTLIDGFATAATVASAVVGALLISRVSGIRHTLMAGLAASMAIGCVGLVLERAPGARLGLYDSAVSKRPWPHRLFGRWYPPKSRVRTYYFSNPRGYYDAPVAMHREWDLTINDANDVAVLEYPSRDEPLVRVEILRAVSDKPYSVQLNQGGLGLHPRTSYLLRFAARADRPRTINVGVAQAHAPWQGLGYYRVVELGTTWTVVNDTLTIAEHEPNARVHFDLGTDAASVELSDVRLINLATDQPVRPDRRVPYSVEYRFNQFGCRGVDPNSSASPNSRRILVLGDSYALGIGVHERDTLSERLGALLNAGSKSLSYQTMNCGVPGWGTRQQRLFYESIAKRYSPGLVLLIMTWNDGRLRLDEMPPTGEDRAEIDGDDVEERLSREVSELDQAVSSNGGQLVIVTFRNTPDAVWRPLLHAISSTLTTGHARWLDLGPVFTQRESWRNLVADSESDWHPNPEAHRLAAASIGEFLRAQGLLK